MYGLQKIFACYLFPIKPHLIKVNPYNICGRTHNIRYFFIKNFFIGAFRVLCVARKVSIKFIFFWFWFLIYNRNNDSAIIMMWKILVLICVTFISNCDIIFYEILILQTISKRRIFHYFVNGISYLPIPLLPCVPIPKYSFYYYCISTPIQIINSYVELLHSNRHL